MPATTSTGYTSDPAGDSVSRGSESLSFTPDGMLDTVTDGSQSQSNVYAADGSLLLQTDPTGTTLYLGDSQLHRTPVPARQPESAPTPARTAPRWPSSVRPARRPG